MPDETQQPKGLHRGGGVADLVVGIGVLATCAGAYLYHPGAALIVFGLSLILIGSRATTVGG
ncbi:hypothetical protein LCGC14_1249910 [marine sediment metagenome]|uniref:Uncharacterized protein n=1 Tax=marine sediment metagenome TaxID=412755 RepID=A0A0F9P7C7_9ZZZZ